MLKKKVVVSLVFLAVIVLSIADFAFFNINKELAFIIHNSMALLAGLGLIYFSTKFLSGKAKHKYLHYSNVLVGLAMVVVHITKLILGKCI